MVALVAIQAAGKSRPYFFSLQPARSLDSQPTNQLVGGSNLPKAQNGKERGLKNGEAVLPASLQEWMFLRSARAEPSL